jgi:hypothetical protein
LARGFCDSVDELVGRGAGATEAAKTWEKLFKKKENYADGIIIKGTAFWAGSDNFSYPVGVVIDEVSKE